MEENILVKKKNKNNKIVSLLLVLGLIVMVIGVSYSYFAYYRTGLYTYTLNGGKMNVIYSETTGNNIQIDNAYPMSDKKAKENAVDFEFTVTGFNESEDNIYYAIEIDYGDENRDRTRLLDSDMKLSLYENGEEVFKNEIFNNLNKQDIHYGYISYGTSSESPVTNTYLLKIWINDNVLITNTPDNLNTEGRSVYSTSEFASSYASYKVNVRADLTYDDIGYLTYDANGGSFTPSKTSLTTGKVTTQKPVMENKGFLGWSGSKNGEVEFKAGDTYTGDYDVLYAVYGNTRNVMNKFSSVITAQKLYITETYFINDTQSNIDTRYDASSIKEDLTYNSQGSVKGWLEEDYLDEETTTQYYKLYVGSEGTTYLNTGNALFYLWSNVTIIDFMNADTSQVKTLSVMFDNCSNLTTLDISNFNTSNVTDMSSMFSGCSNLTTLDISKFNTSKVTNMSIMFSRCSNLTTLDISNFNTSNVTDMSSMFSRCSNLTTLDISNFNTSKVVNMSSMFSSCSNLINIDISNFNTSNVTEMSSMFSSCSNLTTLDTSNFNTSKVVNMSSMFYKCSGFKKLDLSNLNTSQVTTMSNMFDSCSNLINVDVSNFNTSNVTDMSRMFSGCVKLISLDLSNFNTSKVTKMNHMFDRCGKITSLDVSGFDTGQVTDMSYMFNICREITSLDISMWNTREVTNMECMFQYCESLTMLNLSNFDTSNVTDMSVMFAMCLSLETLDLSNFDSSKVADVSNMFSSCNKLVTIYCNNDLSNISITKSNDMFSYCTSLVGAVPFDSTKTDVSMANPDTGYFTRKA